MTHSNDTDGGQTAHRWLRIAGSIALVCCLIVSLMPAGAVAQSGTNNTSDETLTCAVGPPIYGEEAQASGSGALEVAIVSDRSDSMRVYGERLETLKNASTSFIERLGQEDEAAAVSWGDTATLDQQLTTDHQSVIDAIEALAADESGGNLAGGINTATTELTTGENANEDATKVMIVATDAAASNFDGGTASDAAEAAKAEGITVATIAIGSEADQDSLQQLASGDLYYNASDPDALDSIFTEVSEDVEQIGSDLIVNTRSLYQPGQTHSYTVKERIALSNNQTVRNNVTEQASITVTNTSVLSVDESAHTLSATSEANTSTWVRVDATANGSTGCTNVVVAQPSVSNLELVPGLWRVNAILSDSTLFAILISGLVAVVGTRMTTSWGGLAMGQMSLVIGWFGGYVTFGIAAVGLFTTLFIGLNLAANLDYQMVQRR